MQNAKIAIVLGCAGLREGGSRGGTAANYKQAYNQAGLLWRVMDSLPQRGTQWSAVVCRGVLWLAVELCAMTTTPGELVAPENILRKGSLHQT